MDKDFSRNMEMMETLDADRSEEQIGHIREVLDGIKVGEEQFMFFTFRSEPVAGGAKVESNIHGALGIDGGAMLISELVRAYGQDVLTLAHAIHHAQEAPVEHAGGNVVPFPRKSEVVH